MKETASIGAANIYNYLKTCQIDDVPSLKPELEQYVKSILNFSDDPKLLQILTNFGWNNEISCFEGELDVLGLRMALSKKALRLATRASQLGPTTNSKCFVPELLLSYLSHLVRNDQLDIHPVSFFFTGVCLLVDISGFTRLSGQYCAQGKNGIDDLQKATSGYMGQLVEVIYAHGGDIIKFAGDAIICVFVDSELTNLLATNSTKNLTTVGNKAEKQFDLDNIPEMMSDSCYNALSCAMELRDICTEQLTVHVGLSCGEMCFGILGGHQDSFECLISGHCLTQLSTCLDDAPSRNVAMTSEFASYIPPETMEEILAEQLPTGNYLVKEKPIKKIKIDDNDPSPWVTLCSRPTFLELVERFVPLPVTLGFRSGGMHFLAEIREVTTMFMKWDSYTIDGYPDLLLLQDMFHSAQKILFELGAFIRQFLVDDKGCVLIACWGVPTASYLDNSARAIRAASLIHKELNEGKGMECSFGITTGNVYCGCVGNELRKEYAAVGDVVNLSARLMCKAHGGIYIDEATYTRFGFDHYSSFAVLPDFVVKGKSEPINVYAYDMKEVPTLPEPNVEEYEIKHNCKIILSRKLDEFSNAIHHGAHAGRSFLPFSHGMNRESARGGQRNSFSGGFNLYYRLVLLEGKVGTGKGTAVKWFRKEAANRDIRVISVSAETKDMLFEYKLINKLFRQFFGDDFNESPYNQRMIIMHLLKEIYQEDREKIERIAYPAVRIAFGINFSLALTDGSVNTPVAPPNSPPPRLPPRMVHEVMRDLLTFLLNEQPTVLIIEHVHNIDEDSLKALTLLTDIKARSIVLFTVLSKESLYEHYQIVHGTKKTFLKGKMSPTKVSINVSTLKSDNEYYVESVLRFQSLLTQNENTTHIKMDDFNVSEIDGMIRMALNVQTIPLGLAQWVHQLSGGSVFWINEIIEFLKTSSPEEFMKLTEANTNHPGHHHGHHFHASRANSLITATPHRTGGTNLFPSDSPASPKTYNINSPDHNNHNNTKPTLHSSHKSENIPHKSTSSHHNHSHKQSKGLASSNTTNDKTDPRSSSLSTNSELSSSSRGTPLIANVSKTVDLSSAHINLPSSSQNSAHVSTNALKHTSLHNTNLPSNKEIPSPSIKDPLTPSAILINADTPSNKHPNNQQHHMFNFNMMRRKSTADLPDDSHEKKTNDKHPQHRHSLAGTNLSIEPMSTSVSGVGAGPSTPLSPRFPVLNHKSKLDLFIICRFEKLPVDFQRILKTCTVIGYVFSRFVLYGILPSSLKSIMYTGLKHLVKEKWIVKTSGNSHAEYTFSHSLIYETIYDLIPMGDRNNMHKLIGEYYESMNPDDPKLFIEMSNHFSHINVDKAFEYAIRSINYSLEEDDSLEIELYLSILSDCLRYCRALVDIDVMYKMLERIKTAFLLSASEKYENNNNNDHQSHSSRVPGGGGGYHNKNNNKNNDVRKQGESTKQGSHLPTFNHRFSLTSCLLFPFLCGTHGNIVNPEPLAIAPMPNNNNNNNKNNKNNVNNNNNNVVNNANDINNNGNLDITPSLHHAQSNSIYDNASVYSHGSVFTIYNDKGRDIIKKSIRRIERVLEDLRDQYEQENKVGVASQWQTMILRDMLMNGNEAIEERSMVSKMSWTFKPVRRFM